MATLAPNFLDEIRTRTPIAALIGRTVRLSRSGRESKGCCPFHNEKTPSFYVYDDHFHCFGCGEHGDAISFVMKSTGAGFMETVESLAAEAGLEVPKATLQQVETDRKRTGIGEVLAAATAIYQTWLFAPEGAAGLDYLRARGLTDATIKKFELGWSGDGRGALAKALAGQGISTEQLVEAGLMKLSDRGPVDMFFSRVMFPILDRRGNKISFGGRVLGDGQPKYVNGPETPAFSKRRSLYGLNFARDAVRSGENLIIVEGYMDVIALSQAGFGGAVAPLGTALTEDHLAEVWRLSPEPVICFDADNAGRRAAMRTVDLALSALAPDRGLKFLRLPEKEDPDSIIRREGAAGFRVRLNKSIPISEALFGMLAEGASKETPEARAAFYKRLIATADRIPEKALALEYRALLVGRFFAEWRPKKKGKVEPTRQFDPSRRVTIKPHNATIRRGYVIMSILFQFPRLVAEFEESIYKLTSLAPPCMDLFRILQDFVTAAENIRKPIDNEGFNEYLLGYSLETKARQVVATAAADYRPDPEMSLASAADAFWHFYYLMPETIANLEAQRDDAKSQYLLNPSSSELLRRFVKMEEYLLQARSGEFGQGDVPRIHDFPEQISSIQRRKKA
jgi:DNA primase